MDRKYAREYRQAPKAASHPGANATCQAKIVGSWDRGSRGKGHFGVKLDLPITAWGSNGGYGRRRLEPRLGLKLTFRDGIGLHVAVPHLVKGHGEVAKFNAIVGRPFFEPE